MSKILTISGTRPSLIRLSRIIPKLDQAFENIFVFTDQNYTKNLRDIFFEDLEIRKPNYSLNAKGDFGTQIGLMFSQIEEIIKREKPEKALILGDTNSALCAIVCERLRVPVYHMEAGNRCFDKIAEEINRKIIDHTSTINLPYTSRSKENLVKEGFELRRIFVSGNPIKEVMDYYNPKVEESKIIEELGLFPKMYTLATVHRSENVDDPERFAHIIEAYSSVSCRNNPVIVSTHPRTQSKLEQLEIPISEHVRVLPAFGFFDFLKLEKNCRCLFTDSGTAQEEAAILHISCVVTRRATERPELVECGASILGGVEYSKITSAYKQVMKITRDWELPKEYLDLNVSDKIVAYLQGEINV